MIESATPEEESASRIREDLTGLLGFAKGLLGARTKVQMEMSSGLGVFPESRVSGLPGVHLNCEDGAWMRVERLHETKPPICDEHLLLFMESPPGDPHKIPKLNPAVSFETTIEDASDLVEAGLLKPENISPLLLDDVELQFDVKVLLEIQDCPHVKRGFDSYVSGVWGEWATEEKPIRLSLSLYIDLFKVNQAIHTSEGAPPEMIWGIGISRWEINKQRIEMPIIEQSLDVELEDGGSISIRPRDIEPRLSLKPYFEVEVSGVVKLQEDLRSYLEDILKGDVEFSPFTLSWEPILGAAASNLSSTAKHINRQMLDSGEEKLLPPNEQLQIASTWAVFVRPRTNEARSLDLEALVKRIGDESTSIPLSIRGYVETPPDSNDNEGSAWGLNSVILQGDGVNSWEPT